LAADGSRIRAVGSSSEPSFAEAVARPVEEARGTPAAGPAEPDVDREAFGVRAENSPVADVPGAADWPSG
jgi:hypothetical protein